MLCAFTLSYSCSHKFYLNIENRFLVPLFLSCQTEGKTGTAFVKTLVQPCGDETSWDGGEGLVMSTGVTVVLRAANPLAFIPGYHIIPARVLTCLSRTLHRLWSSEALTTKLVCSSLWLSTAPGENDPLKVLSCLLALTLRFWLFINLSLSLITAGQLQCFCRHSYLHTLQISESLCQVECFSLLEYSLCSY